MIGGTQRVLRRTTRQRLVGLLTVGLLVTGCGVAENPNLVANATVIDLTTLPTQDWGCGHGFTLGTTDGRVRLSLWSDSTDPPPGTVAIDGTAWRGELVRGEDLFAQWCDDVIEPGEPEVVQNAVFEVTGTLTWTTAGTGQCDGSATGRLTDGAVVLPDRRLPLPELELRNELFGCLAG